MEHKFTIGNWVNEPFHMQVVSVFQDEIYCNFEGNEGDVFEFKNEDVKPIPLTPEVLEKCGLNRDTMGWFLSFDLRIYDPLVIGGTGNYTQANPRKAYAIIFKDNCFPFAVQYLHQLQNLYFALTGEELTYKP